MSVSRRISIATFGYRGNETRYVEDKLKVELGVEALDAVLEIPYLDATINTSPYELNVIISDVGVGADMTVEGAI